MYARLSARFAQQRAGFVRSVFRILLFKQPIWAPKRRFCPSKGRFWDWSANSGTKKAKQKRTDLGLLGKSCRAVFSSCLLMKIGEFNLGQSFAPNYPLCVCWCPWLCLRPLTLTPSLTLSNSLSLSLSILSLSLYSLSLSQTSCPDGPCRWSAMSQIMSRHRQHVEVCHDGNSRSDMSRGALKYVRTHAIAPETLTELIPRAFLRWAWQTIMAHEHYLS